MVRITVVSRASLSGRTLILRPLITVPFSVAIALCASFALS